MDEEEIRKRIEEMENAVKGLNRREEEREAERKVTESG